MSSHCNRYPDCGCRKSIGTKCQLTDGDHRLLEKEIDRNEKGFPLLEDGSIDRVLTSKEKQAVLDKHERGNHPGKSKKRRPVITNYTPPKKKRKK